MAPMCAFRSSSRCTSIARGKSCGALHRHRRRSRHGARGLSRHAGALGNLALPGDAVRARARWPLPSARSGIPLRRWPRSTRTICPALRGWLDGARSAHQARHRARSGRKRRRARLGAAMPARRACRGARHIAGRRRGGSPRSWRSHAVAACRNVARGHAGRDATRSTFRGRSTQHPNWRRKLPVALEDLERITRLAARGRGLRAAGRLR